MEQLNPNFIEQGKKAYSRNNGKALEYAYRLAYYGYAVKADKIPFDMGDDVPELKLDIKSSRFSLSSNLQGNTLQKQVDDFFSRIHCKLFAYIDKQGIVHYLTPKNFKFICLQTLGFYSDSTGKRVPRHKGESMEFLELLRSYEERKT